MSPCTRSYAPGRVMTRLHVAALRCLPPTSHGGRWLTPAQVGEHLGVGVDVARPLLVKLRGQGLVENDGERPQAFARTPRGDGALEWAP